MERKQKRVEGGEVPAVPGLEARIQALSKLYPELPFEALVRIFRLAPGSSVGQPRAKPLEEDCAR